MPRHGERLTAALSHIPRPHWPRRRERDQDVAPAPPQGVLRLSRTVALYAIAVLITTASGASFAESYRGLFEWAVRHGLSGFWAAAFPLQVDVFIAVGELVLFVAMVDRWRLRWRLGAWAAALLGVAVSVAGNVGHVAAHDLQSRGTAAVPPLSAFAALWLGLTVLKRVIAGHASATPGDTGSDASPGGGDADPADHALLIAATTAFPEVAEGGAVPSIRSIRGTLRVGDKKAARVQEHLRQVQRRHAGDAAGRLR